jgi:hypothetical protein
MAEKYSVLIKYKYLEYIENAKLSKSDSWDFIMGIIQYDKTNEIPVFENPILAGMFAIVKYDIDENREKWEQVVKEKSNAGKKGGAPKGNQNALKNKQKQAKQPNACFDYKNQTEQAKQPDYGYDLDHEFVNENGGGNNIPTPENQTGEKPPPPLISEILKQAETTGFFIDTELAEQLIACTDYSWFGDHSFISFVAIKIREHDKYGKKPVDEQRRIFRKVLLDAENYRREYPKWREEQENRERKEAALAKKKAIFQRAVDNKPTHCIKCGAALIELHCPQCQGEHYFDEQDMQYKYTPKIDLSGGFENYIKQRREAAG